jgi:hypothetical protein
MPDHPVELHEHLPTDIHADTLAGENVTRWETKSQAAAAVYQSAVAAAVGPPSVGTCQGQCETDVGRRAPMVAQHAHRHDHCLHVKGVRWEQGHVPVGAYHGA